MTSCGNVGIRRRSAGDPVRFQRAMGWQRLARLPLPRDAVVRTGFRRPAVSHLKRCLRLSALGSGQRRENGRPSVTLLRSGGRGRHVFVRRRAAALSTLASLPSPTAPRSDGLPVLSAGGLAFGRLVAWEREAAFRAELVAMVRVARTPRRPVLIVTEGGRAVPGATVPVAARR